MTELFLKLVNRSIDASWLILAVIILRLVLRKAPKVMRCVMWCMVGLKLIVPFSIESAFSLIPGTEMITKETLYATKPMVDSGIDSVNQTINPILAESFAPDPGDSVNPLQVLTAVAAFIWIVGVAGLLLYTLGSYLRLRKRIGEAVRLEANIYQSERAISPFVLGLIKPRIYVPYGLKKEELECVIAHERAHIKRCDHVLKPIAFLILMIYWFQPLVWISYILLCRDIELACDERVMREIGMEQKKLYSEALLNCSVKHRMIAACPLAFGELGVKQRIQNVLRYKKPAFWLVLISVIACVICVVCFMTEPERQEDEDSVNIETVENNSKVAELPKEETQNQEILQSPPTMLLQDSLSSRLDFFEVDAGSYSWQYRDGDMMRGGEACGNVPQIDVKGKEWLQLVSYNKLDYVPYTMSFSMQPDCVTVREYDLLSLGDMDAEVIAETVYAEAFVSIPLKPRRIYEVIAEWDESNLDDYGCYGTAYYTFATDNYIKYEEVAESVTLQAHVKEIMADMENTILISSDTDSFPGAFLVQIPFGVSSVEELSGGDEILVTMHEIGESVNEIPVYKALSLEKQQERQELSVGEIFTEEVNNFEGVTMYMEKYKATEGDVEFFNNTDKEIQYGDYFAIQVEKDGAWYSLTVPENIGYHAIAYVVAPGEAGVWHINWEYVYGKLPIGKYRMVKDVMDYRVPGDYTKYYLAAEFEIMESY